VRFGLRSAALLGVAWQLSACHPSNGAGGHAGLEMHEACAVGDTEACENLAQAAGPSAASAVPWAPDPRAEQVKRDVAAIIRGMRRSSASNGF
jgi:hypothetical protein